MPVELLGLWAALPDGERRIRQAVAEVFFTGMD